MPKVEKDWLDVFSPQIVSQVKKKKKKDDFGEKNKKSCVNNNFIK